MQCEILFRCNSYGTYVVLGTDAEIYMYNVPNRLGCT